MDRRRFLQAALTVLLLLFLLVLVFKFRPRVEGPRPVSLPGLGKTATGSLTTRDFRYVQESSGKTSFVLTAEQMVERPGEARQLTRPRLSIPSPDGETVLVGAQGLFDPTTRTLRVFQDAVLTRPDGWSANSTGFRMTPEGELVAEEAATLRRGGLRGRADLMRYQRETQQAFLEGAVRVVDDEARVLTCTRLHLDLKAHSGAMAGPVRITSAEGVVDAPAGQILLTAENALSEFRLGSPATGDGPSGKFRSGEVSLLFGSDGLLAKVTLAGAARLEAKPDGETLETDRVDLTPKAAERWSWAAPGPIRSHRGRDVLEAPSAAGALGGGGPFTADLAGPVAGDGPSGRWKADRGALKGQEWTLLGNVQGQRPRETLQADRVHLLPTGTTAADGHVRGARAQPGAEQLRFSSDHAEAAPGGYPLLLSGNVGVARGNATVRAPKVRVADEETAEATGGAVCRFRAPDGEETLTAPVVRYEGKRSRATASGGAVGQGRDYTVTADRVVAALDPQGDPRSYEALGKARLDGKEYEAEGDRLTWTPGGSAGTATSESGRAVVVQKAPYRRVEGPEVAFKDRAISVTSASPSRRGYLESVPPPPSAPGTPPAPPPPERSPDGR